MAKKEPWDLTAPTNIKLGEACLIGLVAAIGAVLLKDGVGWLGSLRVHAGESHFGGQYHFLLLPAIGLIGGAIAGALIQFVAPQATGSGIPQVKAAILGVPQDLTLRTAAVKLVSCIISLGTGLSMGREGPTVQLSAALSANASELIRSSPKHRSQLIAAGAGAGLAAAFNAPLAGVLFVLEELVGHISGFTVGTAVVACFVAAVLSRLVGVHSLDIEMSKFNGLSTFFPIDIPFYLLLGVSAGLVGAVFNKSIIGGLTFNRDVLKWPVTLTCALAGLVSGGLIAASPPLYSDYSGLREALVSGSLDLNSIILALVLQFILTVIAYSSGAPGGLFAPSLTMGACLGLLVAMIEQHLCGSANAITFAIVGMGAVFCAVARVPMTAVVIIFEMTTDFNVVLPLMICSVVSYLVAEKIDPGSIYDQLLQWGGINPEEAESQPGIMNTSAGDIMQRQVETIDANATASEVQAIFATSKYHGFPVLEEKKVVGIITRRDLVASDGSKDASNLMTVNPVTINEDQSLAEAVLLFDNYKVSRLPVMESGRLVGIITKDDLVRAQSRALHRPVRDLHARSYPIYETRSLSQREGRILVVLENTSESDRSELIKIAASLAQSQSLECMHVLAMKGKKDDLDFDQADAERARQIAQHAERTAEALQVPVHTSVRLARHQSIAVADVIDRREVSEIVVSFKMERVEIKTIIEQTVCPVFAINQPLPSPFSLADFYSYDIEEKVVSRFLNRIAPGATLKAVDIGLDKISFTSFSVLALSRKHFQTQDGLKLLAHCTDAPVLLMVI